LDFCTIANYFRKYNSINLIKSLKMDIQTRKLALIQAFLKIQNEDVISKIEKLLNHEIKISDKENFEPMTIDRFNASIDKSMENSKLGRLTEAKIFKSEIDSWS
jgi:hypothetical protein